MPLTSVESPPVAGITRKTTRVFFPNLDGLRFFCFLSVFFFHSFSTDSPVIKEGSFYKFIKFYLTRNGNLGVNFFFVLSGFLITYLLMVEKSRFGKINIRSFYIRRVLRIWPLFYFCVIFGFFIFPKIKLLFGQVPNETAHIDWYLTFLNNFDFIKNGLPDSSMLGVLWSVAIEEQFYLIWPLLLYILPIKYYKYLFAGIIVLSFGFRYTHAGYAEVLEHHTFSCISDMTVGGIAALLCFTRTSFTNAIANASKWCWILLYVSVTACLLYRQQIFNHNSFLLAADRLVISLLFALVIIEQNYSKNSLFKMSKYKYVSKLGTYTYGLYCLHMIGILIAAKGLALLQLNKNVYEVIFLEGSLSLIISIILAVISYHFFESWFLNLKKRFTRISKN